MASRWRLENAGKHDGCRASGISPSPEPVSSAFGQYAGDDEASLAREIQRRVMEAGRAVTVSTSPAT